MDKLKTMYSLLPVILIFTGVIECQDQNTRALFPHILNLATRSHITVNATCGEREPELFCKLVEHVRIFPDKDAHCDICDASDRSRSHPIRNAIDGSNKWWQSPSVTNGLEYNYVTITLDLRQVYHVAYVIVKAANAPRPGNWILEKSIDGLRYTPWQYFAGSTKECQTLYGVQATIGRPQFQRDDDVICTARYSRIVPLQNGEIFVSLVNGRPGVENPSQVLLEFTSARYVRLRLQKISTLNADLMTFTNTNPRFLDPTVTRRYFYSIKDISISGQCICYGHASECRGVPGSDRLVCDCEHNTCGKNCERCCPGYNQKPWRRGMDGQVNICEKCNCHNHADDCMFNATVAERRLSLNIRGEYDGGGVCVNCRDDTEGINCERCKEGYYRPAGIPHNSPRPCRPCQCRVTRGSTDRCVPDDTRIDEGLEPGHCICNPGYGGPNCNQCAVGYYGYPNCKVCPCNPAGTVDSMQCEGRCQCKENVEGRMCDRCKSGYYNLDRNNPDGCTECYCFGLSFSCQSSGFGIYQICDMRDMMDGWTITTLDTVTGFTLFAKTNNEGWLEYQSFPSQNSVDQYQQTTIYYWQAPLTYLGNRLSSYGGALSYTIKYTTDRRAPLQRHLYKLDVIIVSGNRTITAGEAYLREDVEKNGKVVLKEDNWFKFEKTGQYHTSTTPLSRREFMAILYQVDRILIRATFHTGQNAVYLKNVILEAVSETSTRNKTLPSVEKCICPPGYAGLSCEICKPGYRRLNGQLHGGICEGCDCNRHSETCDQSTGSCQNCQHFTTGVNCDQCLPGYYGDPRRGTPNDCKPCACPLPVPSNNFATRCIHTPIRGNFDNYVCEGCRTGYTGSRCERCSPGYYGNPRERGNYCRPCQCNGNIDKTDPRSCDPTTGVCLKCQSNTMGENCGTCMPGFYGSAKNGDCSACNCDLDGSLNRECNRNTGQCSCRTKFGGRRCDQCEIGFGNVKEGCNPCNCSEYGSISTQCDRVTGRCSCRPGVAGDNCDSCQNGFYGFSVRGCIDCQCHQPGTNLTNQCSVTTGYCNCLPNVTGSKCDVCQNNYWGLPRGGGCSPCDCDQVGSVYRQCDRLTGQCTCRPGVEGHSCDRCKPGYFGFSVFGCRQCRPCNKPGHICDPRTGECVCPPNTRGARCERCVPNAWGYDPKQGCKLCKCSRQGSSSQQCNRRTGQCSCLPDYTGKLCDSCLRGYYNFPQCQKCICGEAGTEPDSCDARGNCDCGNNGQCDCKENVVGQTCINCKPNTFSLEKENPKGCTECFCFERSNSCRQLPYVWSTLQLPSQRASFNPQVSSRVTTKHSFYNVIPQNASWVALPANLMAGPVFWSLPVKGDFTLSYNGYLTFNVMYNAPDPERVSPGPHYQYVNYAEIVVLGNTYHLTHHDNRTIVPGREYKYSVKLHEDYWTVLGMDGSATRKMVMIVLQNITTILVRASYDKNIQYAEITDINLDVAQPPKPGTTQSSALGVETCDCPDKYSGHSCQNPSEGYYRFMYNLTMQLSDPIRVIGGVEKCQCYGHSDKCDINTGVCLSCQHNTVGWTCDQCAPGYYGDAKRGTSSDCRPCPCPSVINNFSTSCEIQRGSVVCTGCKEGYTGTRCEGCDDGFYGNPFGGVPCRPCNCNVGGSVTPSCDSKGHCTCLPGITGIKCDTCQPRHAVENGVCVSCDVGCTRDLMKDMDKLEQVSLTVNITGVFPVPWDRLWKIKNATDDLKDVLANLKKVQRENVEKDVKDLADKAMALLAQSKELVENGTKTEEEAKDLLTKALDLEDIIRELYDKVKDDMTDLERLVEHLFNNQSGINVTAAFIEAQEIMNEIEKRNFDDDIDKAKNENKLADALAARVQRFYDQLVNTTAVRLKLEDSRNRIEDLANHVKDVEKKVDDVSDQNLKLSLKVIDVEDDVYDIENERDKVVVSLGDGHQINNATRELLAKAKDNMKVIERDASVFDLVIPELNKTNQHFDKHLPIAQEYTDRAVEHAKNLTDYANYLDKLFEKARADADAANVYENIVKAIEEAEAAAKKALETARKALNTSDLDRVKEEVKNSLDKSLDLLRRANDTRDRVKDLGHHVKGLEDDLDKVEKDQDKIRKDIQAIHDALKALPTYVSKWAKEVNDDLDKTKKKVDASKKKVDDLADKIDTDLMQKLKNMQGLQTDNLAESIRDSIRKARENVDKMDGIIDDVEKAFNNTRGTESSLDDKLKKLRDKIKQARAQADQVKVSLSVGGKGYRSYQSPSQPRSTNSLEFMFKANDTATDALLVLATPPKPTTGRRSRRQANGQGTARQEYLAVDLYQQKIRFSWDAGSGRGEVLSSITIRNEQDFILERAKWYYVKAERIGRVGTLLVYKMDNKQDDKTRGEAPVGQSILQLDENSFVFVGGAPMSLRPNEVASRNFSGCIGNFHLDENRIGLHNFKNSYGICGGCKEVPAADLTASEYHFDGSGYAALAQDDRYHSDKTTIKIEFKTYWENATLLFSGDPVTGDFMHISLLNKRILVQIYMGGTSEIRMETTKEYNTNSFHDLKIRRIKLNAFMTVGDEQIPGSAQGTNTGLELKNQPLYFGGVPESFDTADFVKRGVYFTNSFFGCMKSVQIQSKNRNVMQGLQVVGVSQGCPGGYRTAGFYGEGFAMYRGTTLTRDSDLSLGFRTKDTNALILLAKDSDQTNYFSLAVIDGRIQGKFSGSNFPETITSPNKYNDGRIHNIAVRKVKRDIEIFIDDVSIGKKRLPLAAQEIIVTEMFLGGVMGLSDGQLMVSTINPFTGCISDIIINGQIFNLSKPLQFEKADIGRCTLPEEPRVPVTPPPPPPLSCSKVGEPTRKDLALTFGDFDKSFGEVNKQLSASFRITFEFRTYYPDGMVFFVANADKSSYVSVQLFDGFLTVVYKNNGDSFSLNTTTKVNNGQWHKAAINKGTKLLKLKVDDGREFRNKIDGRLAVESPIYVGTVSPAVILPPGLVQHSIRGCVRNFFINDDKIMIADSRIVSGVTSCFDQVEPGVYFSGNAYGIFDRNYVVGSEMTMTFEFRTANPNGVFLSVSSPTGDPALTLELFEGQVKLTVNNKNLFSAATTGSEFQFCDNKWHSVQASVIRNVIKLIVNGKTFFGQSSRTDISTDTNAPLFIGGLPAVAKPQGAASSDEFFKGCIRNFSINQNNVDWFSLSADYDIYKTSCPVN